MKKDVEFQMQTQSGSIECFIKFNLQGLIEVIVHFKDVQPK